MSAEHTPTLRPNRRNVLAGLAALGWFSVSSSPARALADETPAPSGRLLDIDGRGLWVDDSGPRDAPVILYIHGGPGVGALEFETYMKPVLAGRARVVSVDQRGVLRSDPIAADDAVTVADTVADFEGIRKALGIQKWQVVGHSFGGNFAMHYAIDHPDSVTRLTLENPAYDVPSSSHWLAASAAQQLNGEFPEAAVEANRLAQASTPVDFDFFTKLGETMGVLGEHRQDLYVAQDENRDMFSRLAATAGLPDERWEQGQIPGLAMLRAADFVTPMLNRVADVSVPMLLVRGDADHATSPDEIAALLDAGATMTTVENAGHFIHVEEPAKFAEILTTF